MSRALDAETFASIRKTHSSIYLDIVQALRTKTPELLEIEFLGKSHPLPDGSNVLIEANSIAIPKTKLVQAFLQARQILFKHLSKSQTQSPEGAEEQLRDATAVLLLMDPEHLTAANTRKRIIQRYLTRTRDELESILRHELYLMDSYLTSRLHRHTKSPTLWSHRRWVLETSKSIQMGHDIEKNLMSVILVAAERHPRNYYAFSHMRWLLTNFPGQDALGRRIDDVAIVKDWCLKHPSDTSGFSALLFCLLREIPMDTRSPTERIAERSTVSKEVLGCTGKYHWANESVFVFLRTIYMAEGTPTSDVLYFSEWMKYALISRWKTDSCKPVQAAMDWCVQNNRYDVAKYLPAPSETSKSPGAEDSHRYNLRSSSNEEDPNHNDLRSK